MVTKPQTCVRLSQLSRIPSRLLSDHFRYQHTSHHWVRILIQLHSRLDLPEICTLVLQTFVHDPLYLLEEIALQWSEEGSHHSHWSTSLSLYQCFVVLPIVGPSVSRISPSVGFTWGTSRQARRTGLLP